MRSANPANAEGADPSGHHWVTRLDRLLRLPSSIRGGTAMAQNQDDMHWMRHALALARKADREPGMNPIGCVIVRNGKLLAQGGNEVGVLFDPTAHAEIVTIRRAGAALRDPELRAATLYTTLQPCGMCTMASIWAKVGRIVFGAGRDDVHPMYFEDRHLDTLDFIRDAYREDLTIVGGVLATECAALYVPPEANVPKEEQFNR
jgi:tRNA(adenine34) deaminase